MAGTTDDAGSSVHAAGAGYPHIALVTHHRVAAGDVTLHYAECGRANGGVPIVLLHGFPELWYAWRRQLVDAGATRHVVAPDLPGYGASSRPDSVSRYAAPRIAASIARLADHLGAPHIVLAGHDWGGVIAWAFAARYPERLERLLVINAPHPVLFARALRHSPRQMLASAYILLFRAPFGIAERMLRARDYGILDRLVQRGLARGYFTAADAAVYRAAWRAPGALTAALNYYRAAALPTSTRARRGSGARDARLAVPTTVLWGDRDQYLTAGLLDGLEDEVADLRIRRVPDASHWIVHERPDLVTSAILGTLP